MKKTKEIGQELDKYELDYRASDMTEGAAAGKMPGVEASKGEAAGGMRAGDMTEGQITPRGNRFVRSTLSAMPRSGVSIRATTPIEAIRPPCPTVTR